MSENKNIWSYDIEVYPNLFTAMFYSLESENSPKEVSLGKGIFHEDVKTFVYAPDFGMDDLWQLEEFLNQDDLTIVGFNNIFYDEPVMDFVLARKPKPKEIFEFSKNLISRLNGNGGGRWYDRKFNWDSIDLMKMMAFDKQGVSLKQASINLKWHRVQDLPFKFDKIIQEDELQTLLDYNLNDVLITAELYFAVLDQMETRLGLSKEYNLDFRSASDSAVANMVLTDVYSKQTGIPVVEFSLLRTERELVWMRNCIGKGISFKTKGLQALKKKIMNTVAVGENKFAFKEKITVGNTSYEIGSGGLHSVDYPAHFKTDEHYIIQDADVTSYYPNIMLINNIIPKHLSSEFSGILSQLVSERVDAKKSGNKTKADGLKITINSIFGKLNSEYFWLQDARALLSVTISGQLYLLMLIEELMLNGIMTISANTDGIVCRIPRELEDRYYKVCDWWQEKTGFELEYTPYSHYFRRDVNNYITIKPNGNVKEKGAFLREIKLNKGFRYPIIAEAMFQYLANGTPIIETLKNHDDILDFCISQKAGKTFQMELHNETIFYGDEVNADTFEEKKAFLQAIGTELDEDVSETDVDKIFKKAVKKYKSDNTKVDIINLQKNNRFYVATRGGKLMKRSRTDGKLIGIMAGEQVQIINDYDETVPLSEYPINYDFYIEEAMKNVREIKDVDDEYFLIVDELGEIDTDTEDLIEISDNVQILPPVFRRSSGTYIYDEEKKVIYRGIAQINYLTLETGELLYSIRDKKFDSFFDFLIYNKVELGLNSRQMETLIKINFFEEFGKNKKLLTFFQEFARIYKPDQTQKTIDKKTAILQELWDTTPNKSFSIQEQILNELDLLGFIQSTWDRPNVLFVMDLDTTYSPKLTAYSLKTGKVATLKIQKYVYDSVTKADEKGAQRPMQAGDFILYKYIEKKPAVRYDNGEFIEIPDQWTFWIKDYDLL